MATQQEIVRFLSSKNSDTSFIDTLKIVYRPYICPFDELLDYVGNDKNIFDIGCGSGQFCALVSEFTNAEVIFGIEVSKKLVSNAHLLNQTIKGNKQIHFESYNGITIPEEIIKYDVVYLIDVLHHIPVKNQIPFLKEIHSKMEIGSKLILKDIDAAHPFVFFNKLHDIIFSREIGNELSLKKVELIAQELSFKILESRKKRVFLYPHYFLILEK